MHLAAPLARADPPGRVRTEIAGKQPAVRQESVVGLIRDEVMEGRGNTAPPEPARRPKIARRRVGPAPEDMLNAAGPREAKEIRKGHPGGFDVVSHPHRGPPDGGPTSGSQAPEQVGLFTRD